MKINRADIAIRMLTWKESMSHSFHTYSFHLLWYQSRRRCCDSSAIRAHQAVCWHPRSPSPDPEHESLHCRCCSCESPFITNASVCIDSNIDSVLGVEKQRTPPLQDPFCTTHFAASAGVTFETRWLGGHAMQVLRSAYREGKLLIGVHVSQYLAYVLSLAL